MLRVLRYDHNPDGSVVVTYDLDGERTGLLTLPAHRFTPDVVQAAGEALERVARRPPAPTED